MKHTSPLNPRMDRTRLKIYDLDLEPIVIKAMDEEEGLGWSFEKAQEVEQIYRRFLTLVREKLDFSIVPTKDVDQFWHFHILDTQKYMQDCEQYFGYYLHHFPYFGMRGDEDAANLKKAFSETTELFEEYFGMPYKGSSTSCSETCSSHCSHQCGSGCTSLCKNKTPLAQVGACGPRACDAHCVHTGRTFGNLITMSALVIGVWD